MLLPSKQSFVLWGVNCSMAYRGFSQLENKSLLQREPLLGLQCFPEISTYCHFHLDIINSVSQTIKCNSLLSMTYSFGSFWTWSIKSVAAAKCFPSIRSLAMWSMRPPLSIKSAQNLDDNSKRGIELYGSEKDSLCSCCYNGQPQSHRDLYYLVFISLWLFLVLRHNLETTLKQMWDGFCLLAYLLIHFVSVSVHGTRITVDVWRPSDNVWEVVCSIYCVSRSILSHEPSH